MVRLSLAHLLLVSSLCVRGFVPRMSRGLVFKGLRVDLGNPQDLTEDQLQEVLDMALGDEHSIELSKKMEESMQEDWDVREGVVGQRRRDPPLKANLDLMNYYARQDFLQGNFTAAEEWYLKCVEYDPVDGRAWLGLSRVHTKRGSALQAERALKEGLYYSPRNPFLMQAYAVLLDRAGRTQQAVRLLTSSVKSNPTHAASWVELARINQRLGRVEEARFCLSSAVEGDPQSYVALQAWGVMESELGNVDRARELFERSCAAGPRSVHALQAWASMEKRLGNYADAEKLLVKVLTQKIVQKAFKANVLGLQDVARIDNHCSVSRRPLRASRQHI